MRIALAGNPNSGKTTMYNALTGRNEKVGNWAGVTVEKKEHPIKKSFYNGESPLIAVDLPGAYSMSPFTSEESITSSYVKNENPNAIINIVDATNLSRSLFFTTQLLELGIPVVVALNKADINKKKETIIDTKKLSEKLGCPVIDTTSVTGEGLKEVVETAVSLIGKEQNAPYVQGDIDYSNKNEVVEADKKRFEFVNKIVSNVEKRKVLTKQRNKQDKIDAVLTNKWAGIPIFVLVMYLVFWISQVGPGVWLAEGYVFEKDDVLNLTYAGNDYSFALDEAEAEEAEGNENAEAEEGDEEAEETELAPFVGSWKSDDAKIEFTEESTFVLTIGDKEVVGTYEFDEEAESDNIVLSVDEETTFKANWDSCDTEIPGLVTFIEMFGEWVGELMEDSPAILNTIVVDGIIGGVGAVVGFLPLVMVMYFLLALLEDCGYMARVSVVLDPIFKKVGLSGKSVIPFVVGTGCSIPGIMACRTIRDERERRATAMLTPFMPCGAKIPVIALLGGLFFPESSWVSPLMYFMGLILIFFGALLIKWISGYKYRKSFFIIELPEYKFPSILGALKSMCARGWAYIVKAGTIILVCNAVVTIMLNFNWSFQMVENAEESILRTISEPFAILLIPLGFGAWTLASAAITGFIAKEEVVGTLGAVFAALAVNDDFELLQSGGGETVLGISAAAGLAYLMFNLFTPPCFAAIGAMNSEIKSKKWLFAGIGLQFGIAYVLSFFVYQGGTLISESKVGEGFVPGLIAVVAIIAFTSFLAIRSNQKTKKEYELKSVLKAEKKKSYSGNAR